MQSRLVRWNNLYCDIDQYISWGVAYRNVGRCQKHQDHVAMSIAVILTMTTMTNRFVLFVIITWSASTIYMASTKQHVRCFIPQLCTVFYIASYKDHIVLYSFSNSFFVSLCRHHTWFLLLSVVWQASIRAHSNLQYNIIQYTFCSALHPTQYTTLLSVTGDKQYLSFVLCLLTFVTILSFHSCQVDSATTQVKQRLHVDEDTEAEQQVR